MLKTINHLKNEKRLLLTGSLLSPDLTEEEQKDKKTSFKSIKAGFALGLSETLMGLHSVSRGWMMTVVMAMIMSWILLITAYLLNQLAQRGKRTT